MPKNLLVDGEMVLYGPVGGVFWDDEIGFTARDVLHTLAGVEGDIPVRLNSGGGNAWDGIAIYNALLAHDGKVTIIVDAIAASAASIIAMAGKEIVMRGGALMMIHDASANSSGTADDHEKSAEMLRKLDSQMAGIYARRTGADREEVAGLMTAETWLTSADAVERGFATSSDEAAAADATASAYDYRLYAHAPEHLRAAARTLIPSPAAAAAKQEVTMTEKTQAEKDAAAAAAAANPAPTADAYTAATAAAVLELCAIAGVSSVVASQMVTAKTPLDQVRADLAKRAAEAADKENLDTARTPKASGSGWDEVTAEVNRRYGVAQK
ncbi:head maturation protease, ClpP-related [Xanthobacter sp. VTT E-85241]|uniref:head maturation protease, ClpP-related n=1 Tax=Roseixanthobacter finlandensis TaxID=3119922 RepID=UPI00372B5764